MANRSYLFSAPELPPATGPLPRPIRGISQYNWHVPWVHQVLVSVGTHLCPSTIWDKKIAIAGDYAAGAERLTKIVERARKAGNLPKAMRPDIDNTLKFLADRKSRQRWLILEAGEILDLTGEDVEKEARYLLREIAMLPTDVANAPEDHAGFDGFWNHVLFFSFKE